MKLLSLFRKPASLSADFLQGRHPYDALDGDLVRFNKLGEILPALKQIMDHGDVIATPLYTDGCDYFSSLFVIDPTQRGIGTVYMMTGIGLVRHCREMSVNDGLAFLKKDMQDIDQQFEALETAIASRCTESLARYAPRPKTA